MFLKGLIPIPLGLHFCPVAAGGVVHCVNLTCPPPARCQRTFPVPRKPRLTASSLQPRCSGRGSSLPERYLLFASEHTLHWRVVSFVVAKLSPYQGDGKRFQTASLVSRRGSPRTFPPWLMIAPATTTPGFYLKLTPILVRAPG